MSQELKSRGEIVGSASESDTRDAADAVARGKYTSTSTQMDLLKKRLNAIL